MIFSRPQGAARVYDGIPNCFVGTITLGDLFPANGSEQPRVELVYESACPHEESTPVVIEPDALLQSIAAACAEYSKNIAPQVLEDRFEDFLLRDHGMTVAQAIELYHKSGIAPFLTLKLVFVSEPLNAVCFDFACFGEDYFDQHGFALDIIDGRVELATPRDLMVEGSYPAARHRK